MKNLVISLMTIILLSFDATCQVTIIDSTLYEDGGMFIFRNHPVKQQGIISEYYTKNKNLKYKYELITKLKIFNAKQFSNYLNNNEALLDGKYIEFLDNGDTLNIAEFTNGNKTGRQLHFKDKALYSELLIKAPHEAVFSIFYPQGGKRMQFQLVNDKKEGEEIHYFRSGNIKLKILNKNNRPDGELMEYYPDAKIKRIDKYENNRLVSKRCYDTEGNICTYTSLIDTFKLIDQQNQLIALRSNPKIKNYLKENSISFSCLIANDNKLTTIEKGMLPDSIFEIIYDWATHKVSWKSEKFSYIPVIAKVHFTITELDSTYFVFRKPYDATVNNHAYLPVYGVKASDYIATEENRLYLAEMEEAPFVMVEDMPLFNGGSADNVRQFIAKNLRYPEEAAKKDIQGRVYLQFVVAKDGSVKDVSILRGVHPLLDNEAIRVIKSMPKWRPGYQRGKPVNVQFTFPVDFVLQ